MSAADRPERSNAGPGVRRAAAKRTNAVLVYLLLLVSLQVFLLVVAVEGVLAHDARLARNAAALAVVVFLVAASLRWFLRDD